MAVFYIVCCFLESLFARGLIVSLNDVCRTKVDYTE